MTNSKLRFGFPLAIALATASAAAVAHGKCESSGCSGDAKITTQVQTLLDRHPDLGPLVQSLCRHGLVWCICTVRSVRA